MNTLDRIEFLKKRTSINSYLEIGVHRGNTFNRLDFSFKVAVDPNFLFNVKDFSSSSSIFHELTSDEFFLKCPKNLKFDCIFIDGLHEYKQTYRDFTNCLHFAHEKTIFIIDDVFPSDVYSSLVQDAVYFRRMAIPKTQDASWHGDVYKTICLIHDLHPLISFKTTKMGEGNPQTFLYKKPRLDYRPVFDSLEIIDRLDYFSLLKNNSFMNFQPEEDVLIDLVRFLNND